MRRRVCLERIEWFLFHCGFFVEHVVHPEQSEHPEQISNKQRGIKVSTYAPWCRPHPP